MPTNAPLNRKLRMGLIGGGQGAFIGRVHATAAVLDNRAALVAGALSSATPPRPRPRAPDYDIPADRAYGSYKEMAEAEAKRAGQGRLRLRRHAQPHALRDRQDLRRGRLQRHLRQAADVRPRAGRGAAEGRREDRRRLRGHAQLHRLPARPPGPRDGPERRTRRDQRRPGLLHPGLAADAAGSERPEAGRRGGPTRSSPGRPAASATSARTPTTSAGSSPACMPEADLVPAQDVRERAGSSTTTAWPRSATTNGGARHRDRVADHPRPRERPRSSRSTARRRRWSGTRRSRTR